MNTIKQKGFTLLELMIALALGLVIVAAAVTLFITGQRSYSVQQGMSENQNNANFGLNLIAKDIRHANLDGSRTGVNERSMGGGIVLTSKANPFKEVAGGVTTESANLPLIISADKAPVTLLSRGNGQTVSTVGNEWKGLSNVTLENGTAINSDQLVIQFTPIEAGGFDCEGRVIETIDEAVIQRYFLRVDANAATTEPNQPLALACDAGRIANGATDFKNYGDAGQIIMQRVDHLRVLLGIRNGAQFRYVDIDTYMKLPEGTTGRPKIISVQLGVLSRSTQAVGDDNVIKADQKFTVLDQVLKVKTPTGTVPKYVRQVVTQTIALRNAMEG